MQIIATFITGLIVGIVAKLLMPGRDPGGFIITGLLGIAGAFVARYIGPASPNLPVDVPSAPGGAVSCALRIGSPSSWVGEGLNGVFPSCEIAGDVSLFFEGETVCLTEVRFWIWSRI
jgi:hypothetical protein